MVSTKYPQKHLPYFIIFFTVTLLFVFGSIYPYQITADLGFQMKSIQQFLRQESSFFNSITLPSTQDLSQDVEAWITWWPPGIPAVFFPLVALGVPLGIAARITSYVLVLLGCLGWLKFAQKINVNRTVLLITSLVLPLRAIALGSVTELIGDVVPFAIMPWLSIYTLSVTELLKSQEKIDRKLWINSSLLCLSLGFVYCIKYSAFTVSISFFIYCSLWGLLFLIQKRDRINVTSLVWVGCCLACFAFFPSFLNFFNHLLTGAADFVVQAELFNFSDPTAKGIGLILSFMGAPGLSLFHASNGLMHLIYFDNSWFSFLNNLSYDGKKIFLAIAGIPGTIVILYFLLSAQKVHRKRIIIFVLCVTFLPLFALGYLSFKIGCNFLIDHTRYTSAYFGMTEIVLISSFFAFAKSSSFSKRKLFTWLLPIALFFVLPNLFTLSYFIKDKIVERIASPYTATENQIHSPSLSPVNAKIVVEQIDAAIQSRKDVVVLALEQDAPFDAWLEMQHRTLPLVRAWGPLVGTHGREGANIYGSSQYKTSENLRLVLVISKSLEEDETFVKNLQKRFPQAVTWQSWEKFENSNSLVSIWYSDLKPEH